MKHSGVLLVRVFAVICAVIGLDCLRLAMSGGIPMPEWTHGHAIYIVPGEVWSLLSLVPPLVVVILAGGDRHMLVAAMAAISGVVNLAIGIFSADAALGFIQSRVALGAGMMWVAIAVIAAADGALCRIKARAIEIIRRISE